MALKAMEEVMLIRESDPGKKETVIHTCNT